MIPGIFRETKTYAMKGFQLLVTLLTIMFVSGCGNSTNDYDAAGNFEADEIIVSAQQNGQLINYSVREGMHLDEGAVAGQIDVRVQELQKEQTEASIRSLSQKTNASTEQVEVARRQLDAQQSQLNQLIREKNRTVRLVEADAAPGKQLDDITAQIDLLKKQMDITRSQIDLYRSTVARQNRSILSEKGPLEKAAAQLQEQVEKGRIINPVNGTVLTNYALKGELVFTGKPLYKIANIDTLTLKAYINGSQLGSVKIGQQVTVRIDQGKNKYKTYPGTISWISDKAEFSPKSIQTKDERANLVYAIKVLVKNDGFLKIGMYGEAIWNDYEN